MLRVVIHDINKDKASKLVFAIIKFQITNNKQIPNHNDQNTKQFKNLELESWSLFGAWFLEFII